MDVHSVRTRSFNMSRIRGANTSPELMIRRWIWARGYRYRLHKKDLPGRPDIVLSRYNVAIFVHGCFWHRHGCQLTATPASRREFWLGKFQQNIDRDRRNIKGLMNSGWRVLVIWECSLRGSEANLERAGKLTVRFLKSDLRFGEVSGPLPDSAEDARACLAPRRR